MFEYLDTMPDVKFMSLIICIIAVAYVAEWAFSRWANGGKR
jgi:hypothetical protein